MLRAVAALISTCHGPEDCQRSFVVTKPPRAVPQSRLYGDTFFEVPHATAPAQIATASATRAQTPHACARRRPLFISKQSRSRCRVIRTLAQTSVPSKAPAPCRHEAVPEFRLGSIIPYYRSFGCPARCRRSRVGNESRGIGTMGTRAAAWQHHQREPSTFGIKTRSRREGSFLTLAQARVTGSWPGVTRPVS
jgi:hypothetical protein